MNSARAAHFLLASLSNSPSRVGSARTARATRGAPRLAGGAIRKLVAERERLRAAQAPPLGLGQAGSWAGKAGENQGGASSPRALLRSALCALRSALSSPCSLRSSSPLGRGTPQDFDAADDLRRWATA